MEEPFKYELKPCPFCGEGEIRIEPQSYWTGMRSAIIYVRIRHWCKKTPLQSYIEIGGKTEEEAVVLWNNRK